MDLPYLIEWAKKQRTTKLLQDLATIDLEQYYQNFRKGKQPSYTGYLNAITNGLYISIPFLTTEEQPE